MATFKEKKSFGPSGLADLRVTAKNVRVVMEDGNTYEFPAGATEHQSGKYIVSLSQDLTKIVSLKPPAGTYIVHFKEFGNRINGIPDKKIQRGGPRQSRDGKKKWIMPDELVFTVVMEIDSEGIYQGLTVSTNLPYAFVPSPSGGTTDIYAKAGGLKRIEEFLRSAGFDINMDIPYTANVLPWLEHILQNGAQFMITTSEKGFVDSISQIPAGLVPPKKVKKATK